MAELSLEEAMPIFYQRLFPFQEMFDWLSYGNTGDVSRGDSSKKDYFLRREWSMTLPGDIYLRYKSYADQDSLARDIRRNQPIKIDIGAVYSAPPRDKAQLGSAFVPVERELVFDIDMDDYDDVRNCCTGSSSICTKCWVLMACAIKVMHRVLTEDFGFQHVLWVFSGRRGIHCWVCDERARKLSGDARGAIAGYLNVVAIAEGKNRKTNLTEKLHPALQIAYEDVLLPYFEDHLVPEQGLLETPERQARILDLFPDEARDLCDRVRAEWSNEGDDQDADGDASMGSSSAQRWADLKTTVEDAQDQGVQYPYDPVVEVVFAHAYPRLDVNVSLGMNHLLKSPWCVHPKTGKICVPVDPGACELFDPTNVPTVQSCVDAINDYDTKHPGEKLRDVKKTPMREFMQYFKDSFLKPLHESIREDLRRQALQGNDGALERLDF